MMDVLIIVEMKGMIIYLTMSFQQHNKWKILYRQKEGIGLINDNFILDNM